MTNEQILDRLVDSNVLHCCSNLVHSLTKLDEGMSLTDVDYDELLDLLRSKSERHLEIEAALAGDPDNRRELEEEYCNLDYDEVFEHWVVTDWFGERLKEEGETVGELFDFTIWGRSCTGQRISMDPVIERIARKMEILNGQRNAWT